MNCFSIQRNLNKLFAKRKYDEEDDEFEIFNAVKVISISVIVFGNTYYYVLSGPLRNLDVVYRWSSSLEFMWVLWADLQVDVFFWLTGFVLSYTFLK